MGICGGNSDLRADHGRNEERHPCRSRFGNLHISDGNGKINIRTARPFQLAGCPPTRNAAAVPATGTAALRLNARDVFFHGLKENVHVFYRHRSRHVGVQAAACCRRRQYFEHCDKGIPPQLPAPRLVGAEARGLVGRGRDRCSGAAAGLRRKRRRRHRLRRADARPCCAGRSRQRHSPGDFVE